MSGGARLAWAGGGEATVESLSDKAIVLRSSVPWPPGSRPEGAVAGTEGLRLRVKVHGCRKQPEGDFLIEGRPIDLSRAVRERLVTTG